VNEARVRLPPIPEVVFQQGSVFFLAHRYEKLEGLGRELIALEPSGAGGHWLLGLSLEQRGEVAKAIAEFRVGLKQNPKDLRTLCALSHSYGLVGNSSEAFSTASRYIDLNQKEIACYTLSYCAALLYTSLGRKNEAFEWLGKARAGRDSSFPFLLYDARFDPIRSDPRFIALADALKDGLTR
jgi:tetratricopeptide (TPR) repeat protein